MLTIGQLRLSLPAGYELRAERIARRIADELARRLPLDGADLKLDHLALPPIQISHSASDHQVASSVASAIVGVVQRTMPNAAASSLSSRAERGIWAGEGSADHAPIQVPRSARDDKGGGAQDDKGGGLSIPSVPRGALSPC